MKAWLKGGLIFSLLSIIISLPIILFLQSTLQGILLVSAPTYFLFIFQFMRPNPPALRELIYVYPTIIITSAIFWFIIGSLIGFIVGKIKGGKSIR